MSLANNDEIRRVPLVVTFVSSNDGHYTSDSECISKKQRSGRTSVSKSKSKSKRKRSLSTRAGEFGKPELTLEERRLQRLTKMNLSDISVDAKHDLLRENSSISVCTVSTAISIMSHEEIKEFARRGIHKVHSKPSLYEDNELDARLEDESKAAKWQQSRALKIVGKLVGGTVVIALAPVIVLLSACGGVALLSQPFENSNSSKKESRALVEC